MNRWVGATSALAAFLAAFLCFHYGALFNLARADSSASVTSWLLNFMLESGAQQITAPGNVDATSSWNILYHLGGNSPWIPKVRNVAESSIDPPPECWIDQVHMLSRHAERYPTVTAGIGMLELYQRIQHTNVTLRGDLAFAHDWEFITTEPAKHFEDLVSTGENAGTLDAFATGVKLRTRYKHLLDYALEQQFTTFWASDSKRVVDTARYFAAGFYGIDWADFATLHVVPETLDRAADTLTPGRTCLRYRNNAGDHGHDYGYRMIAAFRKSYEPQIVERLAKQNPEFPFTEAEVFVMQQICGFETIAKGYSPWCEVFTSEEWESFEYARDVIHYYRAGPGNPYSGAMGWLWLNATKNLLEEGSSVGPLFFSFVHDGDIVPFLSALDLFPQTPDLPTSHVLRNRTWRTSDVVPMGGRIILERMICPAPENCWSNAPFYPNHVYCEESTFNVSVRVNINDGIVAIPGCSHGPASSCPLEDFIDRVKRRGVKLERFGKICGLADDAADRITFLHQ